MKILIVAAVAASALAIAAPASAELYSTLGYSNLDMRNVNLDAGTARLGWKSATPFGVEGELSTGIGRDETGGVKEKLKLQAAIYGTATADVGNDVSVFARVGWGTNEIEFKPGGSDTHTSVNYGVGANWMFNDKNGVRADYTRVNYDSNQFDDTDVWSLSYVRRY
jgi:hypothetical protein